jgi:hypothetical protein
MAGFHTKTFTKHDETGRLTMRATVFGQDDCDPMCVLCERISGDDFWRESYEMYDDEYYCEECMIVHVKEELNSNPWDEVESLYTGGDDYLYELIYGDSVEYAVETIENWWFTQRKKMLKKPTKSANKTM